jgi:hypothetical protein
MRTEHSNGVCGNCFATEMKGSCSRSADLRYAICDLRAVGLNQGGGQGWGAVQRSSECGVRNAELGTGESKLIVPGRPWSKRMKKEEGRRKNEKKKSGRHGSDSSGPRPWRWAGFDLAERVLGVPRASHAKLRGLGAGWTRSFPLAQPAAGLRLWRIPFAASQAAQVRAYPRISALLF